MAQTPERRLWWRHLLSFLFFPVTMTIVIPALIAMPADVRPRASALRGQPGSRSSVAC